MTYQKERARHEQMSCFFFFFYYKIENKEFMQQKLLLYIEEKEKCMNPWKICGFWIVLEKVQKNKKKTCIIASDWIY